jgi:hypothetical protein
VIGTKRKPRRHPARRDSARQATIGDIAHKMKNGLLKENLIKPVRKEEILMSNGNLPAKADEPIYADEVYPVYERERAPNWLFLAILAAIIYWVITSYVGH